MHKYFNIQFGVRNIMPLNISIFYASSTGRNQISYVWNKN